MFLPIGDTPNPRNFVPVVNYSLIGLNVAIFILVSFPLMGTAPSAHDPELLSYLQLLASRFPGANPDQLAAGISAYDLFVFEHGFKPGAPEISDLLSSMFLHGGFMHLAGNMLFLWIYGDNVEHRLGRLGYLVTYLLTGLAATLGFSVLAAGSVTPLVGASGAISGVLGVYFLLFPHNHVKIFVMFWPFFMNTIVVPARWVLGMYVVVENFFPLLGGVQTGVAYGAHLGGFFAGLGMAAVGEQLGWKLVDREPTRVAGAWRPRGLAGGLRSARSRGEPVRPMGRAPATGPLAGLRTKVEAGDRQEALVALSRLNQSEIFSLTSSEHLLLAGWLSDAQCPAAALHLLRRGMGKAHHGAEKARFHLALGQHWLREGQPTSAYQYLLDALDQDPDPQTEAAARQALSGIDVYRRR